MKMYKIIDEQGTGWRAGLYFNDKDEIRQSLIDLHCQDAEEPEQIQKMTLDEVLDYGEWSIEEVEVEIHELSKKRKIKINLTENDLQELQSGESFEWTFPLIVDGKETDEWVDVELEVNEDEEEY